MDLDPLENKMNRQQIIIAQREAMDKLDAASSKYASCRRRGQCPDSKGICLNCPAYLAKQDVQKDYDQCTEKLKLINSQIIKNNDVRSVQQYEERKAQRIEKRAAVPKPLISTKKAPRKTKKKEGSQETMRTNTPPVAQKNQKLTRNDLTEELYIHHKLVDKLPDTEVQNMYNIPRTTFEKWKRDEKMSEKLNAAANDPNRAKSNEVDESPTKQQVNNQEQQLLEQKELLQEKFAKLEVAYAAETQYAIKLRQQLQIEREMNQARHETIVLLEKDKEDLLQQIHYYQNTGSDETTAIPLEQDDVDYKQLYEDTQEILKQVRVECDHHKTRAERLRDTLDDTNKHFNEQKESFDEYECLYLERLLSKIKN